MNFQNLTETQKGAFFLTIGIILFLYSVGIFKQSLHLVILIGSLILILYGFLLGDFLPKIKSTFSRIKK